MSEKFGLVGLETVESRYLDGRTVMNCADRTAAEVDNEVISILAGCYEEAKKLLSENREIMDKIADHLIEKETITGKEFMEIYCREKGIPVPEPKAIGAKKKLEEERKHKQDDASKEAENKSDEDKKDTEKTDGEAENNESSSNSEKNESDENASDTGVILEKTETELWSSSESEKKDSDNEGTDSEKKEESAEKSESSKEEKSDEKAEDSNAEKSDDKTEDSNAEKAEDEEVLNAEEEIKKAREEISKEIFNRIQDRAFKFEDDDKNE